MTSLRAIARSLSKIDNVPSVVTIATAATLVLYSVFGGSVSPQANAEIIVALLGLVALTGLLERESRLTKTDRKIDLVQTTVADFRKLLRDGHGTTLFANDKLPPSDTLLDGVSEIFIAGAYSFNLLRRNPERWKRWLRDGKRIKVIAQNPWNKGLEFLTIPTHSYKYDTYRQNGEAIIQELEDLKAGNSCMEVRVSDTCPTQGVVIVDGHNGGKRMIVALYLPGCGSANRPTMMLDQERDHDLFTLFFEKYYVHLWSQSKPLTSVKPSDQKDQAKGHSV